MNLKVRYTGSCPELQRDDLVLFAGSLDESGALTIQEDFMGGLASLAHYYPGGEGRIMRYRRQIGTRDDLEVLGLEEELCPDMQTFFQGFLTDPNWDREPS